MRAGGLTRRSPAGSSRYADATVRPRRNLRFGLALVVASYGALFVVWAFSSPPAVAADEIAHYLRAAGVARGQWILPNPPALSPEAFDRLNKGERRAYTQTRVVVLPRPMSPHRLACYSVPFALACPNPEPFTGDRKVLLKTNMGTSPPYAYVIPGAGTLLGDNAMQAMMFGRLAVALSSGLLIGVAAIALWQHGRAALAMTGLLAATTPMVLSVGGSLTVSGPEVVSGICFFACLLRLSRNDNPPGWLWIAAGFSGFVLAVTRQLGPFWLLMQLALFVGLIGIRPALARARAALWQVVAVGLVIGTGVFLNAFWQIRYEPHPVVGLQALSEYYDPSWTNFRELGKHSIGVFGPLDTTLNPGTYFGWIVILISLGTLAFLLGTRRHRILLLSSIAFSVTSTLALETVQASVGFGAQGRQLLPIFVTMPMVSAEIIFRNRQRLAGLKPRLVLWISLAVSVLHAAAWYGVGRRYAMGPREEPLFASNPLFQPPGGWRLWASAVLVASLMLILFGLRANPGWADVESAEADSSNRCE